MRTYEYKSITEGHKGADTRHDDDPGTSAEGNQQAGSVLNYSVGHPYRDPESVQYHENTGRRYAGGGRDFIPRITTRVAPPAPVAPLLI